MSKHRLGFATLLVAVGLLVLPSLAHAVDFTATYTQSSGKQALSGKLYVRGKNVRQEETLGKMTRVTIANADKSMIYLVDPSKKVYYEVPANAQQLKIMSDNLRGKPPADAKAQGFKVTRAGTQTVSGYPCEKTVLEQNGAKFTSWYSKKLDLAVKTQMTVPGPKGQSMTMTQEYKNIKVQAPAASLFVPPAGFKKEAMPKPKMPPATGPGRAPRGPGALGRGR